MNKFICSKCGKEVNLDNDEYGVDRSGCHEIRLGRIGYGSVFDGCDLKFNLCDNCMKKLVDSFTEKGKNEINYSGCWKEYKPDKTTMEMMKDLIENLKNNKYYKLGGK